MELLNLEILLHVSKIEKCIETIKKNPRTSTVISLLKIIETLSQKSNGELTSKILHFWQAGIGEILKEIDLTVPDLTWLSWFDQFLAEFKKNVDRAKNKRPLPANSLGQVAVFVDDAMGSKFISYLFSAMGFEPIEIAESNEIPFVIKQYDLQILYADVSLDKKILKDLKMAQDRHVRVLVSFEGPNPSLEKEIYKAGIGDLLYKPFDREIFRLKIRQLQRNFNYVGVR